MKISLVQLALGGMALTVGGFASSQTAPAPPAQRVPDSTAAAAYDPRQLPAVRGAVERLTLTARGDVDGFILKDGTEIKTAPHLSTEIASLLQAGDGVTIHGLKAAALPLVRALSVTDETSHRTVTDMGPRQSQLPVRPPPAVGPSPPGIVTGVETTGRVRMALHGPQGEVNGILLESGSILRFAPDQPPQLTQLIQPHQLVIAEGTSVTNAFGTAMDVLRLGASRDQLMAVGPPLHALDRAGPGGTGAPHRPPAP